jgi:hypothetical protein
MKRKPAKRFRLRLILILALVTAFGSAAAVVAQAGPAQRPKPATPYQAQLRAQVDTGAGAPRDGRDPAALKQTSLAAAAAKAQGNGARVSTPAKNATKDHAHDVMPDGMVMDPATTGRLASGCAVGYGQPGAQCLPAKGPNGVKLTCAYVLKIFPHGVAVLGKDALKLDANGDKLACGPGDPI